MREVTVLWDGSDYTYDWLSALFWAKQEFRELGYSIKLFTPQKKYINTKPARRRFKKTVFGILE